MALVRFLPDRQFLELMYLLRMGKKLDLKNPRTFNEKLQWLKLYDRRPEYVRMVDKYEGKQYIVSAIGERYVIPTLGVWNHFDEIDFNTLPNRFVLKCTHDSGGLVICRDKNSFDFAAARKKIERSLQCNFFWVGREWPYKDVLPRIIAEQYLETDAENGLQDYKIHSFNGIPKTILVCQDRFSDSGLTEDFFDPQWKHLDDRRMEHPNAAVPPGRPQLLQEMLQLSEKLSQGFPFMRTDFYEVNGRLYFGELTLYPASGMKRFASEDTDIRWGEWLRL